MARSYPCRLRLGREGSVMIDRPASHRQLDLLVFTVNAPEPGRMSRAARGEVTTLLKLLMAEHVAAKGLARPTGAADD